MSIYSIYRVTNKANGKIYIGFTKYWPRRKDQHIYKKDGNRFHRALIKYGRNNFVWELLYQSTDKYHTLNIMEPYFIKEYDSFLNGYNDNNGACEKRIKYHLSLYDKPWPYL